ncbi:hypothetical protein ASPBRDRAFT_190512 [Aspergillus brasiliensis CBS 101740]|uniref:Major facilitator superfamily (MFS) profile domain-containing protein n=1 Tax=Aspergillus brasiliensis (strain CBS 101740 / IMI 381727 / IBT 21946) TaxID=767769 RepID=A0A1L9V056_ASPBC|nr:hypothetical protein ASPBRDRAFT_190512 [Aspergillus brasiliensis CBS 101740]
MGFSYADLNNASALNFVGLAAGCFLFIPFVVKFGRRPVYLLSTVIHVAFTGLIYGFLLAWVSVLGAVQSLYLLYPPYNFNSAQIGLFNLSGLVGGIIGSIIGGPLTDWVAITISRRNHGIYEPEYRLYLGTPTDVYAQPVFYSSVLNLNKDLPGLSLPSAQLYTVLV